LLATDSTIAAVHAGWRGIAARIVPAAVQALGGLLAEPAEAPEIVAWIGPAIGPCCYQTGADVAAQVAAASHPGIVHPRPGANPHLDLQAAVHHQLRQAGVATVHAIPLCTQCRPDLHSYRRDGPGAGRNHAFIWRSASPAASRPEPQRCDTLPVA
jgi:copper oxidase (laccase) domain-containing protein